jgi:uroporphyrinogen decarboxylase
MNMQQWAMDLKTGHKRGALPILSFPGTQLLGVTVREAVGDGRLQARCMKAIADRFESLAAVTFMDLSVEAEAFGASIRFADDEVPTVTGRLLTGEQDVRNLAAPPIGAGRTGEVLRAIEFARTLIDDRPVLAGMIGPFSLAGRLMDMTGIMIACYEEPAMTHRVLEKAAAFLGETMATFKAAGADGVIVAEPAAGLISPALCEEFSSRYLKPMVAENQDESFLVVYHNCGNTLPLAGSIAGIGAGAYHLGNAIDMPAMLAALPPDVLVMGNLDPVGCFRHGTARQVESATRELLAKTAGFPNFVPSSGCDIPPATPLENIDAFFLAVRDHCGAGR